MRFFTVPISNPSSIAGIWILAIIIAWWFLVRRPAQAIPHSFRVLRTPVALLISSLLLQSRTDITALLAYCTAIVALYVLGIAVIAGGRLQKDFGLECAANVGRASTTLPQ
jgi:hypothetical protein